MSNTYERRKAKGLCPACGGIKHDEKFVTCGGCRMGDETRQPLLPVTPKWFIGLHEWMIQQGKRHVSDYEI